MAKIILNIVTEAKKASNDIRALKTSLDSLAKSFSNIKVNKDFTAQINALTKHYNAVAKAAEKAYKINNNNLIQEEKLAQAKAKTGKAIAEEATAIEKSKTQYAKHQKAIADNTRAQEKHEAQMKKTTAQTKKSAEETKKHSQSIGSMIPNIMKWQAAMTAVMLPLRTLQKALDSVNETLVETEKRVIALERVAGDAANAGDLYDLAKRYGQSFDNVSDVVERFAKSGYDWADSIKAAEAALIAMNVAELDAEQASEGLIAVMKQYGFEIEDLNHIIGVLNKTSDSAAVTTEELLIALQKTGSTAKNANIGFEETVGLITALSEGTAASGQNIGNALRSLIVFTSDNKALDTFAGLSQGMGETVKNFRSGQASILDVWKGLGGELASMGSQKGTLEDLFGGVELTEDIEGQLTQITDSFAEIYGTAGNYRQNYFIALLNNIEEVTRVTENLGDVTSYSQKENEKALDTYEKKVTSLQAKWQELANDEQGFLAFKKGLVDTGSVLLTIVDWTGGLHTSLLAIGTVATFAFGDKIIKGIKDFGSSIKAAATAGFTLQSALGWVGVAATAFSLIVGHIGRIGEELENQKIERLNNALSDLGETSEKIDQAKQSYEDLVKTITTARAKYDEAEEGTAEYNSALAELNTIQEKLAKSENEYGKEIDIVNGKIEDQIELLKEQYGKEIKTIANDYITKNWGAINEARERLEYKELIFDIGEYIDEPGFDRVKTAFDQKLRENSRWVAWSASTLVNTDRLASKDRIALLEELRKEFEGDIEAGAIIQKMIEDAKWGNYDQYSDLLDGSDSPLNAPIELLEKLARGTITAEQFFAELEKGKDATDGLDDSTNKLKTDLSEVSDKYNDIVASLEKARDLQKEAYEFEEKKKAVLEAEKALEEAQKNRLVKVYNSETGDFDYVSNEKDIQKAQEALEKARLDIEKQAFDDIITEVKSGNTTNEAILKIIGKWATAYGSGDFTSVANEIAAIIKEETGIDINAKTPMELLGELEPWEKPWLNPNPVSPDGKPTYDSGGVLHGLGGIKATAKPETVLDPSITAKILEPTSNAQFTSFANSLGLLFGVSRLVSPSSPVQSNHSSTDSHDNHYTINGVPVPVQMAENHSIRELFDLIPLV